MEFDRAQIKIRPRPDLEAIDLGVLVARRYWWRLVAGWLIVAVPVFVAVWFLPNVLLALLVLWWLKPIYERIPMTTVASSIFGEHAKWRSMQRNLFSPDCLLWLTVFRFFPGRSTLAPIAALEEHQSHSGRVRQRRLLIKEDVQGAYFGLHSMGLLFELAILLFFLVLAIWFFSPIETDPSIAFATAFSELVRFLFFSFWGPKIVLTAVFVAFACVAPFYVCCGFALYLNRRIELEGWDLDLEFQRMVRRIAPLLGVLLVVIFCMPSLAKPSTEGYLAQIGATVATESDKVVQSDRIRQPQTQYVESENPTRVAVASEIENIVRSDRISRTETRYGDFEPPSEGNSSNPRLALLLHILAWTLLIAGILWLVFKIVTSDYVRIKLVKTKRNVAASHSRIPELKKALTLPNDIVVAARDCWESGHFRDAMSLLYRGALYSMITEYKCNINPSDTEASCMRAVHETTPELSDSFDRITQNWQKLAYARLPISDEDFAALSALYLENFRVNA
ncbi:MAG: DUF4129 domain-containing protein [Gammaproteobacteria bacterium]|nr:DUF4129 domain-containing protein [Gammaproteobacteria bacterium]